MKIINIFIFLIEINDTAIFSILSIYIIYLHKIFKILNNYTINI